jgi:ornithine cyclodeaminase/alanine dehydrogenase-like protein (mu-crystallin family)
VELRLLNAEEVRRALPMREAVEAMKRAFGLLSAGEVSMPLRSRIEIPSEDAVTLIMPALAGRGNGLAVKIVSVFPRNSARGLSTIHALIAVIDPRTGEPSALLEGASLTAIRTGAASGAATDLLAPQDARTASVFGSGAQARTQLEAVCTVRRIETAWVFGIDAPGVAKFVEEMRGRDPVPSDLRIASAAAEAAQADVICTATTASSPVFEARHVRPGAHINAIGSYTPTMQEIDPELLLHALIVVDSRQAALVESGDLIIPLRDGRIREEQIHAEIGEIVNGTRPGRTEDDQITFFKSVGVAVQDAVAANVALHRAAQLGLGRVIQL